jgi:N-acetylglucosamine-6-sulfatase
MKGVGYRTAYIGKYFNGYGEATSSTYRPPGWTEWNVLARGLYDYRSFTMNINRLLVDYSGTYQTEVMGDLSTRFIRRNADSPFLMVTSFKAPHSGGPRERDDPTVNCFDTHLCGNKTPAVSAVYRDSESGHAMPASPAYDEADVSDKPAHIASQPSFQPAFPAAHQELWEQQLESIHSVDDQIRRIVWTLRQAGVLRRTYILVTSDNGYLLGEHRIPFGKVHPYEPSARIPMMLRGPAVPAGRRVKQLVGLQDIAPTVLRATGSYGARTLVLDGVSLLPLANDPTAGATRDLVLEAGPSGEVEDESALRDASPAVRAYRGIRTDDGWKYIRYGSGEQELYDLNTDPHELTNLANDPLHAQRLQTLAEATARLSHCAGRACQVSAAP